MSLGPVGIRRCQTSDTNSTRSPAAPSSGSMTSKMRGWATVIWARAEWLRRLVAEIGVVLGGGSFEADVRRSGVEKMAHLCRQCLDFRRRQCPWGMGEALTLAINGGRWRLTSAGLQVPTPLQEQSGDHGGERSRPFRPPGCSHSLATTTCPLVSHPEVGSADHRQPTAVPRPAERGRPWVRRALCHGGGADRERRRRGVRRPRSHRRGRRNKRCRSS